MGKNFHIIFFTVFIGITSANISNDELEFPELKYVDTSVDPCDNFYKYACGNYEKYNPKPENELMWDNFIILQKKINNIAIDILKSDIRNYDAEAVVKAKDMYTACINSSINAEQGIDLLRKIIDDLGGWPLINDIPKNVQTHSKSIWDFIADTSAKFGLQFILNFDVIPYSFNNVYQLFIGKDSLSLPSNIITYLDELQHDLDFLENIVSNFTITARENIPFYQQYLIDLSMKFIREDYRPIYENIIVEGIKKVYEVLNSTKNAGKEIPGRNYYDSSSITNLKDLQIWSDQFSSNFTTRINWNSYFSRIYAGTGVNITDDTFVYIMSPVITTNLLYLVENTPSDVLINFVILRLFTHISPDANLELWELSNNFYKQINKSVYSREEYCMRKVTSYPNIGLSFAVAHEFQNYHFDLRKLEKPSEMIDNLSSAFLELIEDHDWMDDESKNFVQRKTNAMFRLIGFPEFIYYPNDLDEYYKSLKVCLHDHFGNANNLRKFNFIKNIEVIDKTKDRSRWNVSPLYANTLYNPQNNRMLFPAAIMNEPMFTQTSSLIDYSRIGFLIGHEITHGFDTNGRLTDEEGNFVGPWNETVEKLYNEKVDCFQKQYAKYYIEEIGEYLIEKRTTREDIADNGGLREAFRAFQKLKNQLNYPEKSGQYTVDQLYFISYATLWCRIDTVESLKIMQNDEHAPSRFRVIGPLSNMEEFVEAFKCPEGSNMNRKDKCVLW